MHNIAISVTTSLFPDCYSGLPSGLSPRSLATTILGAAKSTASQRHQGPKAVEQQQSLADLKILSPLKSPENSSVSSSKSSDREEQAVKGYYTMEGIQRIPRRQGASNLPLQHTQPHFLPAASSMQGLSGSAQATGAGHDLDSRIPPPDQV